MELTHTVAVLETIHCTGGHGRGKGSTGFWRYKRFTATQPHSASTSREEGSPLLSTCMVGHGLAEETKIV
ncbi:hypothetical protein F2Q69_00028273 [Brassica cretica]|uniref:Uncharacterized protein n=1 Tax=Brassica cretica TaxID=69181 RepID=A0A8S9RVY0_BRACR|nr:hypothetical protein F2Q69_00028273 [Brassica cretica]